MLRPAPASVKHEDIDFGLFRPDEEAIKPHRLAFLYGPRVCSRQTSRPHCGAHFKLPHYLAQSRSDGASDVEPEGAAPPTALDAGQVQRVGEVA